MSQHIFQNTEPLDGRNKTLTSKKQRQRRPLTLKFSDLPDEALVPINVVCDVCGNRPTAIYDGIKKKTFPVAEKFGLRCSRWRVGQLRRWLANPRNYYETPNTREEK